jgi:hypothetical protein
LYSQVFFYRRGTCHQPPAGAWGYWRTYTLVALEEDDAAALVARGEVVARLVELYRGDDIRGSNFGDVLDIALVAEAPGLASAGP